MTLPKRKPDYRYLDARDVLLYEGWTAPREAHITEHTYEIRPMQWEDQGERDPSVSDLAAALWKAAATLFGLAVIVGVVMFAVWLAS